MSASREPTAPREAGEDAGRRHKVAVIGLGRMGAAAAKVLVRDHDVVGWDVRDVRVEGVGPVASPAEAIESSDVAIAFLPSAQETMTVLAGAGTREALETSECVFVDASTSAPADVLAVGERLGDLAGRLLDAPILGRPESAGEWTMPVGGDATTFERALPVLSTIASRVFHVGPLGSGHTIKLLNNTMFAAINVITAEVIGACDWLGVSPERFVEIVGGSTAATVSPLFRSLAPRMLGEDLESVFTVSLLHKDLRLALQMLSSAGAPLVAAPALATVTNAALDAGLGDHDSSALVKLYRKGEGKTRGE